MTTSAITQLFRVEAFSRNPSECDNAYARGNLHDSDKVARKDLKAHARSLWLAGYWVEIFDEEGELKEGPIDPEAPFPALLF